MDRLEGEPKGAGTWVLFESGHCKRVHASLHAAGKDRGRPVDGYVVTEGQTDFTRAARRAAQAIYAAEKHYFEGKGPVSVAYDLEGPSLGETLTGESAGLAFAVALTKRLHRRNPGPVAATGEITGGPDSDAVGPVKGILEKLAAAVEVLPQGGWVLCPKGNEAEITDALRRKIDARGLNLCMVSSVSEALSVLFPSVQKKRSGRGLWIGILIFLICSAAAATAWLNNRNLSADGKTVPVVTTTIEPKETSVPITMKPSEPEKPVTVSFSGDRQFAAKIADQLSVRMPPFLLERFPGKAPELSGVVSTIRISEETDAVSGKLMSELGVAIKDLVLEMDGTKMPYETVTIHLKGAGSAGELIPLAADRLYRAVCDMILKPAKGDAGTPPARKMPSSGKGFD